MEIIIHGKPNAGSSKSTSPSDVLSQKIVGDFFDRRDEIVDQEALIVDARNWNGIWYSVYTYRLFNLKEISEKISKANEIYSESCIEMLTLANNYKTFYGDKDFRGRAISVEDYNLIIDYYRHIHKIMYLLSVPTLRLIDKDGAEDASITLKFFEPNYKKLIEDEKYRKKEIDKCNNWLKQK